MEDKGKHETKYTKELRRITKCIHRKNLQEQMSDNEAEEYSSNSKWFYLKIKRGYIFWIFTKPSSGQRF
jgi:hypothetical protein